MEQRFYSDEEAESILRAASQRVQGGMSRDTLLQTAAELGISAEDVAEAERSLAVQQKESTLRSEFHRKMKQELFEHLFAFVLISGFLIFIDFHLSKTFHWSFIAIGGWFIGLASQFATTFNMQSESYQQQFEKWKKKRRKKERREAEAALG